MRHKIIIYRFSGKQGFFTIPKKWCEECDLLIHQVHAVLQEQKIAGEVELIVRPWFLWFWAPLFKYGSFHAPMLIINGRLISAGIVPDKEKIVNALKSI